MTVFFVAAGNFYSIISKHGLGTNYLTHIDRMHKKYAKLPDNAVVIFGERELKYLRPNIRIASPKIAHDLTHNETWDNFLLNLDVTSQIFVETGHRSRKLNSYHESVKNAINALPADKIVQIEKPTQK